MFGKKIIDPVEFQESDELFETVLWQWQSGPNPDPWAEEDRTKWTWQDYLDDDCRIIEEAFLLNKEIADLKDYEIDLKKMVQVNKQYKNRIRRVRRQENSRFMIEIPEPIAILKDQKTMNEAFGTIQHFLDYIMKRTPEAYELYRRLKTLTLDSPKHEFEDIIQEVITCIDKGAETKEKIIQTRLGPQRRNFLNQAKRIVHLLKSNTATLRDFLKAVLKSYTMETFICYWLNELLRSEDWEEMNILTPYLVCLVYSFKLSDFLMKSQDQGFLNSMLGYLVKPKLYLYRGAALTKEHLDLYDPEKVKYFSWNGVTSTSREKKVGLKFLKRALQNAKDLNQQKIGVFFIIETDFASAEDCEGMIDLLQHNCTKIPSEKEVILTPGTVFKLQKVRLIGGGHYEISLKITKKFEKTKDSIALLGILQEETIFKDKAIIDGLPSQKSFRVLELLKGNKLIRRLEIRNSGLEDHIMEEIENLRATTNVKREDVKLVSNTIVVSSLSLLVHRFSAENLNDIFLSNKIRFKNGGGLTKRDVEIKTLVLNENVLDKFKRNHQLGELNEKLKEERQIAHLELSVKKKDPLDTDDDSIDYGQHLHDDFTDHLQSLKELKSLQSLHIKTNKGEYITRIGLEGLCQTIGYISSLNRLHLELNFSNDALIVLDKTLVSIGTVKNLSLDLKFSSKNPDEDLNHLRDALISLTSLRHLSLNFVWCQDISDQAINNLSRALTTLTSLQHLSLDFWGCDKISDEGLNSLEIALNPLRALQHLSLCFTGCKQISDEGVNNLKTAFILLTSLQHLSLDFGMCDKISNQGLDHLKNGFKSIKFLKHLSLNFNSCNRISDEGISSLKSVLISIMSLEYLSLDFSSCNRVSDEGINSLKDGLISLTSLQHLSLNFTQCKEISDEGLNHLKIPLRALTLLQHLSLDFWGCDKISDEGLDHLEGSLISLTSLKHLEMNFMKCGNISDEGLNHLTKGFAPLISLQHFSLYLVGCNRISDEGLNHLKNSFVSLTDLQHLALLFNSCNKISDEGLSHLRDGLISLRYLKYLFLDFGSCNEISDEGLDLLKNGILSLEYLQKLEMNFRNCVLISDKGRKNLFGCVRLLPSLQDHLIELS